VFYKGALTFREMEEMPLSRLLNLDALARRIVKEQQAAMKEKD